MQRCSEMARGRKAGRLDSVMASAAHSDAALDSMRRLINGGVARAAGMLNQMTASHVDLAASEVSLLASDKRWWENYCLEDVISAVRLEFSGSAEGAAWLIFPPRSSGQLVSCLIGERIMDTEDMDTLRLGALQEVGNIVLNGAVSSLAGVLGGRIEYMPPDYCEGSLERLLRACRAVPGGALFLGRISYNVDRPGVAGDILLLFQLGAFDKFQSGVGASLSQ
ncbi:MAG: chemotaxis protein CheC [Desulfovibrionales bacterium]|nr:chemotaxis protein CheC [Desulfovibrionales bacterium]